MTKVSILPEPAESGEVTYRAIAGQQQSVGKTAGEALDALTASLPEEQTATLVVVQHQRPDRFFSAEQQARLTELMARWRAARDGGIRLSPAELSELDALVEVEVISSGRLCAKLELDAIRILRKHFVEKIVTDLRRIEQHAGKPNAADYAASLFRTMRQVRDQTTSDPFAVVVMALHNALAYKNRWGDYAANQYEQARSILIKFANQELYPEKVEKAVMELEAAGFDTTPFEVEFSPDEE